MHLMSDIVNLMYLMMYNYDSEVGYKNKYVI